VLSVCVAFLAFLANFLLVDGGVTIEKTDRISEADARVCFHLSKADKNFWRRMKRLQEADI
jgi:hypothetical protein